VAVTGQSVQMMGGGGPVAVASKAVAAATSKYNDKFILHDSTTGQPIANHEYAIVRQSGAVEYGTTDDAGHTHLLSSQAESEDVKIYAGGAL